MKLQVFTPCDKVLQDPTSGPSLIATFQKITASTPADQELPPNAVIPREWSIFCVWALEKNENNRAYVQVYELYWPDGSLFATHSLASPPEKADQWLTFVGNLLGFPIGQKGNVRIVVRVESEGKIVGGPEETYIMTVHTKLPTQGASQ
jgi:hypothetical protein